MMGFQFLMPVEKPYKTCPRKGLWRMIIKSKTTLSYVGDMNIQRDNVVEARRPDIMVVNKKKKKNGKM